MPFADKVVHVTISGAMMGGAEEWQTGFYVGLAEGTPDAPNQQFVDAVRDAWKTFFQTANHAISSSYSFTQVKAARLGTDGKYDGTDVMVSYPATAVNGPYAGSPLPPQCALVATLIAGSGKGLAGKGRMFLPGVSSGIGSDGKLATLFCQQVSTGLATFFNSVNAGFDTPGSVINASRGHKNLLWAGARNVPVNGVRIGNVYDTQRRRRNSLSETYYHTVVTP